MSAIEKEYIEENLLKKETTTPELRIRITLMQCCGSGSGLNGVPGSGSGSRRAKMTHKN
jgi:hypothetical protein